MSGTAMERHRAGGMGGGEADIGILEGDAAFGRDAEADGRLRDRCRAPAWRLRHRRASPPRRSGRSGPPREMAVGGDGRPEPVATASLRPRPARKSSISTTPVLTGRWASSRPFGVAREALAEILDPEGGAIEILDHDVALATGDADHRGGRTRATSRPRDRGLHPAGRRCRQLLCRSADRPCRKGRLQRVSSACFRSKLLGQEGQGREKIHAHP